MITKIDHIGIAVKNIEDAIRIYSDLLGLEVIKTETIVDQKIKTATIMVGEVKIELVQPTQTDGPIGKFIGKRGGGIHHIAYRVDDIDSTIQDLCKKKVHLINETPKIGLEGSRIVFIHPKDMNGVLVELVERNEV